MINSPITNLRATPDLSQFEFKTETTGAAVDWQVRFYHQKKQFYEVEFANREPASENDISSLKSNEYLDVVMTVVLILHLYSKRYPSHILQLRREHKMKSLLSGHLLGRYLLESLFTIKSERQNRKRGDQDHWSLSVLTKRREVADISAHSLESNGQNAIRIINAYFKIEFERDFRLDLSISKT